MKYILTLITLVTLLSVSQVKAENSAATATSGNAEATATAGDVTVHSESSGDETDADAAGSDAEAEAINDSAESHAESESADQTQNTPVRRLKKPVKLPARKPVQTVANPQPKKEEPKAISELDKAIDDSGLLDKDNDKVTPLIPDDTKPTDKPLIQRIRESKALKIILILLILAILAGIYQLFRTRTIDRTPRL